MLLAFAFLLSLNLHGQELPGTSLPGAATTVSSQDKADKTEQPEVEKLDPVTVKELQDVVRTNIFAVSKRNINMALSTIHPESPTKESSKGHDDIYFCSITAKVYNSTIESNRN